MRNLISIITIAMSIPYYIFSNGRLSKQDNSLVLHYKNEETRVEEKHFIPIENVDNIYCFGQMDCNSALLHFLGRKGISLHFFDFYEHYTRSFIPRKDLLSGKMLVQQALFYHDTAQRLWLAKRFIMGATKNMYRNLKYYLQRGKEVQQSILKIENLYPNIKEAQSVQALFGVEGNIRIAYYEAFDKIITGFTFDKRSKNPPVDAINSLISFLNMVCYTICTDAIHHTQLNTTIGFLHEPSERRHSLALDVAEVFKPLLVDRTIFTLVNKKMVQPDDFEVSKFGVTIKTKAKKKIIKVWDEKLSDTIFHRELQQYVSYKTLVQKECYKLQKHLLKEEPYKPFHAWW